MFVIVNTIALSPELLEPTDIPRRPHVKGGGTRGAGTIQKSLNPKP